MKKSLFIVISFLTFISFKASAQSVAGNAIALQGTYGVPLRHTPYESHHNGNWNLELTFSPDLSKFFKR